jgi:predicted RNA-binding Zn ribbon-like protein
MHRRRATTYLDDGRNAALNFINTYKKDYKGIYRDSLRNYEGFLIWCEATGVICQDRLLQLELEMRCYEREAEQVFDRVVSARHCLSELFNCLLAGREVHAHVLHFFNDMAAEVRGHLQYEIGERGLEQFWMNINEELAAPLWFVMSEAMMLIDSRGLRLVKKCPLCGSLFVDGSRSSNRRWCNPNTCGSVRKSVSYYHRKNNGVEGMKIEKKNEINVK